MGTSYKDAGVDIDAGDALVEKIKPHAARTNRPEVISGVGGFGGLFALRGNYKEPVLVSGTDGVGTKLKVAFLAGNHRTIGIDLVAMSVNDVITSGAEPLFFLDYYATSKLEVDVAADVVGGIADACEEVGCALLGGETAELPGFYTKGEYDLAGFCVGVVERSKIIDGQKRVKAGDSVIGIPSSGLHSNGYSLARKVLLDDAKLALNSKPPDLTKPLGDELLTPTRLYWKDVRALIDDVTVHGFCHVTGSGIPGNLPRILPPGTKAVLDSNEWKRPPIFELIQRTGNVAQAEMYSTFNMGLGFLVVLPSPEVPAALRALKAKGTVAFEVGRVEADPSGAEPMAVVT